MLVVDNGASERAAVLGDILTDLARKHGKRGGALGQAGAGARLDAQPQGPASGVRPAAAADTSQGTGFQPGPQALLPRRLGRHRRERLRSRRCGAAQASRHGDPKP